MGWSFEDGWTNDECYDMKSLQVWLIVLYSCCRVGRVPAGWLSLGLHVL
jgi:hypothetical protein